MPAATLIMFASATPQLKKRLCADLLQVLEQLVADVAGQQDDPLIRGGELRDLLGESVSHAATPSSRTRFAQLVRRSECGSASCCRPA